MTRSLIGRIGFLLFLSVLMGSILFMHSDRTVADTCCGGCDAQFENCRDKCEARFCGGEPCVFCFDKCFPSLQDCYDFCGGCSGQ